MVFERQRGGKSRDQGWGEQLEIRSERKCKARHAVLKTLVFGLREIGAILTEQCVIWLMFQRIILAAVSRIDWGENAGTSVKRLLYYVLLLREFSRISSKERFPLFLSLRVCVCVLVTQSRPTLCDPWTVTSQAPLSMEFSRQIHWSELWFLAPGDLPGSEIKSGSLALQADSLPSETAGQPFTHGSVVYYVNPIFPIHPTHPFAAVSTCPFSTYSSRFLPWK